MVLQAFSAASHYGLVSNVLQLLASWDPVVPFVACVLDTGGAQILMVVVVSLDMAYHLDSLQEETFAFEGKDVTVDIVAHPSVVSVGSP